MNPRKELGKCLNLVIIKSLISLGSRSINEGATSKMGDQTGNKMEPITEKLRHTRNQQSLHHSFEPKAKMSPGKDLIQRDYIHGNAPFNEFLQTLNIAWKRKCNELRS